MIGVDIPLAGLILVHPGNLLSFGLLYADPGSGALAWQLLLSLLFGAMFYARTVTRKVRTFLADRKGDLVAQVTVPGLKNSSTALPHTVPRKSEDY